MKNVTEDPRINWVQLADLVGGTDDGEREAELGEMWRDMRDGIRADWARLDAAADDKTLSHELHRVRGVVATWGMDGLAAGLLEVERASGWRVLLKGRRAVWVERRAGLVEEGERVIAAVEARYPKLAGGA